GACATFKELAPYDLDYYYICVDLVYDVVKPNDFIMCLLDVCDALRGTPGSLQSRDVDLCLIPELPFFADGEGGLLDYVKTAYRKRIHGQEPVAQRNTKTAKDASGYKLLKLVRDVHMPPYQQEKENGRKNKLESG
ncbi:hypothetical protein M8C21_012827, partial [Ambrosia artemisiifolia]